MINSQYAHASFLAAEKLDQVLKTLSPFFQHLFSNAFCLSLQTLIDAFHELQMVGQVH